MSNSAVFGSIVPAYSRYTFKDIFPDVDTFKDTMTDNSAILDSSITATVQVQFYYMMLAKYSNTPIAKSDGEEWIYDLIFTMNAYLPTFIKKDAIQKELRSFSTSDVQEGFKSIYNHAYNPSTTPSTGTDEELPYVNDQNVNKTKKNVIDALSSFWEMLHTNLWEELIRKFQKLFSKIVSPANNVVYIMEDDEDEE